jgi:cation diffusion facilitator CzcD-associated flavoprotein CzcO
VRNGPDHRGKLRVLVVGAGNSGCDLAVDTAQHRLDVDIVLRDGVHFQPKAFFGVPRQQVSFLSELSPSDQDLIARLLARVSLGPWCNYPGIPQPGASCPHGDDVPARCYKRIIIRCRQNRRTAPKPCRNTWRAKLMLATARNDDLEDPSGEGVAGQAGAPSDLHPRYRLALSPNGTKGAQKG